MFSFSGPPVIKEAYGWKDNETRIISLKCEGYGTPTPRLTYFWGQMEVSATSSPTGHEVNSDGVLVIGPKVERGLYRCRLTNTEGADETVLKSGSLCYFSKNILL